jgi:multisubunit Na+/H+ antiporter MnhC subunit
VTLTFEQLWAAVMRASTAEQAALAAVLLLTAACICVALTMGVLGLLHRIRKKRREADRRRAERARMEAS